MPMYRTLTIILVISLIATGLWSQVVINEYSVSNLSSFPDNYGKYEDWIELHNTGGAMVLLSGYYLSDDAGEPMKWQIPAGISIAPGEQVRFWASGRNEVSGNHYHTNFRMTQCKTNPEHVVLTSPAGQILDQRTLEKTQLGHSRGRKPNGTNNWFVFTSPTPGATNNNSAVYVDYAMDPVFSQGAGFFISDFYLSLSCPDPNVQIRYTLDGSEPVASSNLYSQPLLIAGTQVVKARSFSTSALTLPSQTIFHTYFMSVTHNLPVVSVAANQLLNLLNGNQSLEPIGSFEYFDTNGIRTTITSGEFNEHGQDSWVHPQRSIDYISRDEMGVGNTIRQKFFNTSDRDEFQRVILRAAGDDNYPGKDSSAHLRDVYVQNLAAESGMHLDMRRGRRCVVYANGQYWGIYSIREKVSDHDYTDFYYGQGKYDIQFVMTWGNTWAEYGGQQALNDWNALKNFIMSNSMAIQSNYEYVTSQYDIRSLVDYIIINSFVVCSDWLNWNVGIWRGFNPNGTHHKWGYILWDEDATFGHYINYTGIPAQTPYVSPCFPEQLTNNWQDPEYHIRILNRLRDNVEFNQYYINRYIDLLNTAFQPARLLSKLDSSAAVIAGEMPRHVNRWGGSVAQWQANVNKVRNFIINRSAIVGPGLVSCYSLSGPYPVRVKAEPAAYGMVQINSLILDDPTWQGVYYGGTPIRLKALPASPNHELDYWTVNHHLIWPNDSAPEIVLNLTTGDTIVAHFRLKNLNDSVVINEINYNSSNSFDPEDWVEIYNPMPYVLDVSQWVFKDEDNSHIFTFPQGTQIQPYGYLVICRDTAAFSTLFPTVSPRIGNTGFGLSSGGELIRVFNPQGILIDHVTYGSQAPWPTTPNGGGATLELKSPGLDNALASSWMASPVNGGTPGAINTLPAAAHPVLRSERLQIQVFPNPAQNAAYLQIQGLESHQKASVCLYNLMGERLFCNNVPLTQLIEIPRNGLPAGLYVCRIHNRDGRLLGSTRLIFTQ